MTSADNLLKHWGAWWCQQRGGWPMLGYGCTPIGRAAKQLPSTRCPRCQLNPGWVWVVDLETGRRIKSKCPVCNGAGSLKLASRTVAVSPAFIRGQGVVVDALEEEPVVYREVDEVLHRRMTQRERIVCVVNYAWRPGSAQYSEKTREAARRCERAGFKLSRGAYDRELRHVKEVVLALICPEA
jgi:hypothetical protein